MDNSRDQNPSRRLKDLTIGNQQTLKLGENPPNQKHKKETQAPQRATQRRKEHTEIGLTDTTKLKTEKLDNQLSGYCLKEKLYFKKCPAAKRKLRKPLIQTNLSLISTAKNLRFIISLKNS